MRQIQARWAVFGDNLANLGWAELFVWFVWVSPVVAFSQAMRDGVVPLEDYQAFGLVSLLVAASVAVLAAAEAKRSGQHP